MLNILPCSLPFCKLGMFADVITAQHHVAKLLKTGVRLVDANRHTHELKAPDNMTCPLRCRDFFILQL